MVVFGFGMKFEDVFLVLEGYVVVVLFYVFLLLVEDVD